MRKGKIIISLISIFLVILSIVCINICMNDEHAPFDVRISDLGNEEQIKCLINDKNEYYLFIPSYADLSQMSFGLNTDGEVKINGKKIMEGMSLSEFRLSKTYDLQYSYFGKKYNRKITFVRSANVATAYIRTESGSMENIHKKKGNEESGEIKIYSADGRMDYTGELTSIKGRGNNTWEAFDKKPYSIQLKEESELLGMSQAGKWVLLANADDYSNLRNKLVYDFSDEIGLEFSPDSRWVDLYLNGEYAGLYLLSERNEVDENRVNIDKEDGALLSIEQSERLIEKNEHYIYIDSGMHFRVHYPLIADEAVTNSLTKVFQNLENALLSKNSTVSDLWSEYIDLDSWAKRFLIDEIFGNLDGFYASSYFYTVGSKVYAGPVWDYDKAMGNDNDELWAVTDPEIFILRRYRKSVNYNNLWIEALYQKKEFRERLLELLTKEYSLKLEQLLNKKLPDYANQIAKASEVNALRWMEEPLDYQAEIKQISDYIKNHTDYIYEAFNCTEDYCNVTLTGIGNDLFYSALPGENLPEGFVPTSFENKSIIGWYRTDTDEPFDITQPITEDIEIYPVLEESVSNKTEDIIKLIPIVIISVMFIVLFVIEFKRIRNGGGGIWQKKRK